MEQIYKGHQCLLKALALCKERGIPLKASFVGEGRLRPRYEELSHALKLTKDVCFHGGVAWGPHLFKILDGADLFVFPSLTEGLGKALIEAMARGLPAVASDVGGISELLTADVLVPRGEEIPLADKLASLATDPNKLTDLSRRNFQTAQLYRHAVLSPRRLEFYRRFRDAVENTDGRVSGFGR
jgi:glycosyltransferase involved in cell wall biosynthesis